jgi:O-antigen ligase
MTTPSLVNPGYWPEFEFSAIENEGASPRVHIWRKIILWTVAGYLIFNNGFEMIRIPPAGAGIPIGELVLVISFLFLNLFLLLPRMATEVWIYPIIVWWIVSLSRSIYDLQVGGPWSFRDASQAIESLFLIVGFWLANTPGNLRYFFRWMRRMFLIAIPYGLLFPLAVSLQKFSPKLPGMGASSSASLFFQMTNTPVILLWTACWLLIDRGRSPGFIRSRELLAGFLVAYAVAFAQSRTIYLGVLVVGMVLFITRSRLGARWMAMLLLGALIVGAISVSGVEIKGRLGKKISLDFIVSHFEAISGKSSSEATEGAAEGVPQRIGWWTDIYKKMIQSPENVLFGLGYGIPLTDFHYNTGALVREPHNSYVSVTARLGVTGILIWLLMQGALYSSWRKAYRLAGRMGWDEDRRNLLLLLIFNILVLNTAIGEDGLEKPFYAIPYYLFFGVILRYGRILRRTALESEADPFE